MGNNKNIGKKDLVIRIILAIIMLLLSLLFKPYNWLFYSLSIILLITVIVGFCPFYALFNINTNKKRKKITKEELKKAINATAKKSAKNKKEVKKSKSSKGNKKKTSKSTTKKSTTKKTSNKKTASAKKSTKKKK